MMNYYDILHKINLLNYIPFSRYKSDNGYDSGIDSLVDNYTRRKGTVIEGCHQSPCNGDRFYSSSKTSPSFLDSLSYPQPNPEPSIPVPDDTPRIIIGDSPMFINDVIKITDEQIHKSKRQNDEKTAMLMERHKEMLLKVRTNHMNIVNELRHGTPLQPEPKPKRFVLPRPFKHIPIKNKKLSLSDNHVSKIKGILFLMLVIVVMYILTNW